MPEEKSLAIRFFNGLEKLFMHGVIVAVAAVGTAGVWWTQHDKVNADKRKAANAAALASSIESNNVTPEVERLMGNKVIGNKKDTVDPHPLGLQKFIEGAVDTFNSAPDDATRKALETNLADHDTGVAVDRITKHYPQMDPARLNRTQDKIGGEYGQMYVFIDQNRAQLGVLTGKEPHNVLIKRWKLEDQVAGLGQQVEQDMKDAVPANMRETVVRTLPPGAKPFDAKSPSANPAPAKPPVAKPSAAKPSA